MCITASGFPVGTGARSAFFVASENAKTGTNAWIFSHGTDITASGWAPGKLTTDNTLYASGLTRDAFSSSGFWPSPVNNSMPKLGGITYSGTVASFYDAGTSIGTTTINWTTGVGGGYLGAFISGSERWKGNIAEVIYYSTELSATDREKVQSYLAVKYGVNKAGDYISSANTVIWDSTVNATYHNDVFGIGQDDTSGLIQVSSNSSNTGSGDGTGQSAKGNIVISSPSALVNNTFLIIGHDTSALSETDITFGGSTTKRVQRMWKVQTTGSPGNVALSYDTTGLTYSGQSASDYVLLVDPTGAGDFNGGSVVSYQAATLTGNKITFNGVILPTGAVFTFQTLAQPTIQATNINFASTSGTTTTASWTNGNGSSRAVFIYAGASGSPTPVNNIAYTANTVFGTGTQIGTTGWYCVYNGTGTTVSITGLTPGTPYQLMTNEYMGTTGNELYLSTISTGNPASITTLNNVATLNNLSISAGTLNPVFATGTTNYTTTVPYDTKSLTVTPITTDANASVTINSVAVTNGSPSGPIDLNVGSNVITTTVTAQDGITMQTYTITVTRTEPIIVATGTLSALNTIYGTASESVTFDVSGTDISTGILVTAPTEFEVSSDNTIFTNAITIIGTGTIASTPVYIRLKATAPVNSYSGDVVLTSSNAATVNIATILSTVNPKALTITADSNSRAYGAVNPTLTATYSGFANGETSAVLSPAPTITTTANATSAVGLYPVTASGAANPNYTITYVPGNLEVTATALIITADNKSRAYGEANPVLTVTYSGFVNDETAADLETEPTITTTADATSVAGEYPIIASGAVSSNYAISYIDGRLTILLSNIATLSNLSISNGTLDPRFESDITNYNTRVGYNINSVTVIPTITDAAATITVNGIAVADATSSTPIILNAGDNVIRTVVTAEDGITKQTYNIVVYKEILPDASVINNVLSPNQDGKNDFWKIKDIEYYPNNKVTVYDRAGRVVYSRTGYNNEWDGSYKGSPLKNDTYYYLLDLGDNIPKIKGFITIMTD